MVIGCGWSRKDKGVAIGAGAGAVIGGIIGNEAGNTAAGAILGAVIGGAMVPWFMVVLVLVEGRFE